jgi:4-amino-4-deoxy-L-arabinose transferase-like glycosyltransferase
MTEARALRWLTIITLAGMALRIVWALMIPVEPASDSAAYLTFARTLVDHGVYGWTAAEPGAYWPVGTSAIAAATFWLLGDSFTGVVWLNLLAGLAIILLTWRLGNLWFDRQTALLAAACVAFWPNLIFFTTILSSELWFIALTLGGLWAWARPAGWTWANLLLAGVIWGLACYVRPVILLLPVALAMTSLPLGWQAIWRASWRAAVAVVLIMVVVSPWTYRNTQLFGERVMVSTNFGPNLWMGNNPETTGGYMPLPTFVEGMTETERAKALDDLAKDYIRQDPAAFALRSLSKAVKLHARETIGVAWNEPAIERLTGPVGVTLAKAGATGYWFLLLAFALGGLLWRLRTAPLEAIFHPTTAAWGYFTALHAIIVVEDRYHMPASPFIALLAASGLAALLSRRPGWEPARP